MAVGAIAAVAAAAGPADDEADRPSVADLLHRIERLEQDKSHMQDEIQELRARLGEDWMTEERAAQIKEIVADVLADADTRSSLLSNGMTAGWDGRFFLASADDRFRLNVGGQLQMRWIWNYHDVPPSTTLNPNSTEYKSGFENSRTQLFFYGHVFNRDLTYRIQTDFNRAGGLAILKDAWVRWGLNDEWALRGGQFKLPFMREELVRSWNQQLIERSLVNQSLSLGYTQGFEIEYADNVSRWALALSDGGTDNIGGFNITGLSPAANSPALLSTTDYAITSRYECKIAGNWGQFKQFTSPPGDPYGLLVGIAGHWQFNNPGISTAAKDEVTWLGATGDISAEFGGGNIFGSLTWEYVDAPLANFNIWGAVIQGGTYFTEKFEAYGRFEYGQFIVNGSTFGKDLMTLTLGGNYYFDGQDVKFSADIGFGINRVDSAWSGGAGGNPVFGITGWRFDPPGAEPQVVVRTQLQLLF